ncbi:MAG: hydrogenase iron-sulfur subunit [Ignavibacteria bacterium]|nr:hydrogenase iron-sulfur subunit [Ignavibacteria bacterium]
METSEKLAVYICSGCDIASSIDCNKLLENVEKEFKPAICKLNNWVCNDKFVKQIRKEIEENKVNKVVIAACSPRFLSDVFRFENIVLERVNLREQVAWTHPPNDEHTNELALDYVKMGISKAVNSSYPIPIVLDVNSTILVVGGGITGLNSAIACAETGYNVILIEKEKALGGFYKNLHKLVPKSSPYLLLETNNINDTINKVLSNPRIEVLLNTTIDKISGQPGMFDVEVKQNGEKIQFQVGAIIQATGWKPYDANRLNHLGYGILPNVITNIEFEQLVKEDKIKDSFNGKKIENVVFIQCAGSRDPNHLPYCSTYCCNASLKQALYVREINPDAKSYIIYKDIRTPAQYEKFYKRVQSEDNIFLTKGEVTKIEKNGNGKVSLEVSETLIASKIKIEADLVVLAIGMVPTTFVEAQETEEVTTTADGKKVAAGAELGAKILNLTYRQGTDLPTLRYGFPDSHYICFPYETRRTGIYAAGTVRSPMDGISCVNDAYGAALKAIQVIESVRVGKAVHPRSGDTSYPDFFLQRCTQCKRCTEECPFGTLDEDDKGTPKPNPNRCRRCGICMGACPERIISFKNYSPQIISSMIKSLEIPESDEEKPRILAFLCENDAYPSLDIIAKKRIQYSPFIRIIPVRCLGSVNIIWIADALSMGFDGIILIGCKYGEDYQCHFIRGSELANKRMENVQEKLKQLVLEPERVEIHTLSIDEFEKIPTIFNNFAQTIEKLGPNPYKDM